MTIDWHQFTSMNAHQIGDMLMTCTFAGHPCGPRNFTAVHTDATLCYTFNKHKDMYSYATGYKFGLKLALRAELEQYQHRDAEVGFR